MFAWLKRRGIANATETKLVLRTVAVDAARFGAEGSEPAPRVAEPRPLADVIAGIATLQPKPVRGGFEIADGTRSVAEIRAELSGPYMPMMREMTNAMAPINDMLGALAAKLEK